MGASYCFPFAGSVAGVVTAPLTVPATTSGAKRTRPADPVPIEDIVRGCHPPSIYGNVQSILPVSKKGNRGSLKMNVVLRGGGGCSADLEIWGKEGKDVPHLGNYRRLSLVSLARQSAWRRSVWRILSKRKELTATGYVLSSV